jgi:uncharacterized protein with GYD domain
MARYLFQLSYTPEAWAAMLKEPQNRVERVAPALEQLGGRFVDVYYTLGDYDIIGIMELPDNVGASAFAMAVIAGGAAKAYKTTPLVSVEEGIEAMRKGGQIGYRPPS